jgi:transposase
VGDGLEAQIAALIEENAGLRAAVAAQTALIDNLVLEVAQLKARLGMNSKNSSKPASSDGYSKPSPKSRRGRSGNKPGKQPGAPGHNLAAAADPEIVVDHVPDRCGRCGNDLADAPVTGEVRRQVFDLPPV